MNSYMGMNKGSSPFVGYNHPDGKGYKRSPYLQIWSKGIDTCHLVFSHQGKTKKYGVGMKTSWSLLISL